MVLWVWELQHNEGYRSMFTIVIVASKNSQTTVSPSTGTHYMKMRGWIRCSNTSARRSCEPSKNVTQWKPVQSQSLAYFNCIIRLKSNVTVMESGLSCVVSRVMISFLTLQWSNEHEGNWAVLELETTYLQSGRA